MESRRACSLWRGLFASFIFIAACGRQALAQPSGQPIDLLAEARELLHRAQWPEADRILHQYIVDHPDTADAHYLLAYALFREDQPKNSLAEYTRAAQLREPTALDLRWVALDYVLLKDYSDANTWISKSIQWNSGDGESWYELGRIQYEQNRFKDALTSFRQALNLMPRSVKAENNLGLTYQALNFPEDALAAYQQAVDWQRSAPDKSEQPYLNLGLLLVERGQNDQARPVLEAAQAIAPKDPRICAALGQLYMRQNKLADAEREFRQALVSNASAANLHFQLGQVLRREAKSKEAAAEFAAASHLDGTHSSAQ